MSDLYAERVEAELELIEVAIVYLVVWSLVGLHSRLRERGPGRRG